jgi:hypothetical protein
VTITNGSIRSAMPVSSQPPASTAALAAKSSAAAASAMLREVGPEGREVRDLRAALDSGYLSKLLHSLEEAESSP